MSAASRSRRGNFITRRRAARFRELIADDVAAYEADWSAEQIGHWQLQQFNALWETDFLHVPFYADRIRSGELPSRFESWGQFRECIGIVDRTLYQQHREAMFCHRKPPDFWLKTGGSTAQPIQFPRWKSSTRHFDCGFWTGRSWWNITPIDRVFMLWGHSHIYGTGLSGFLARQIRQWKDRALGYCRFSAYRLDEERLREAADELLDFQPDYIIAFANALDRMARANTDQYDAFHLLKLKGAIASAEAFHRPDSAEVITDVLGCPLISEYGTVECGVLGYQHPRLQNGQAYQVMWRQYLLEYAPLSDDPRKSEVIVTSLYPRAFPLVRYKIGDILDLAELPGDTLTHFDHVHGRLTDYIKLPDGSMVHSGTFIEGIKEEPRIRSFQIVVQPDQSVALHYTGDELDPEGESRIRLRLGITNPHMTEIPLVRCDQLEQTAAGKTKMVVRRTA